MVFINFPMRITLMNSIKIAYLILSYTLCCFDITLIIKETSRRILLSGHHTPPPLIFDKIQNWLKIMGSRILFLG